MNFGFLVRCDAHDARFYQVGEQPPRGGELLSVAGDDLGQAVFLGRLYYRDDLRRRIDPRSGRNRRPTPRPTSWPLTVRPASSVWSGWRAITLSSSGIAANGACWRAAIRWADFRFTGSVKVMKWP